MKAVTLKTVIAAVAAAVCLFNLAMTGSSAAEPTLRQQANPADLHSQFHQYETRTAGLFGLPVPQQWLGQPRSAQRNAYPQNYSYQNTMPGQVNGSAGICPNGNCGNLPLNRQSGYLPAGYSNSAWRPRQNFSPQNQWLSRGSAELNWDPAPHRNALGYSLSDNRRNWAANQNFSASGLNTNSLYGAHRAGNANCANGRCLDGPNGQCQTGNCIHGQGNCSGGICNCPGGQCQRSVGEDFYAPAGMPLRTNTTPSYRPANQYGY